MHELRFVQVLAIHARAAALDSLAEAIVVFWEWAWLLSVRTGARNMQSHFALALALCLLVQGPRYSILPSNVRTMAGSTVALRLLRRTCSTA